MPSNSWANGWITGDIPSAAEFAKGWGAIYDTTLGVASATIDVTGIIATYAHLRVEAYLRGDTAAASTTLGARFNNDSAGNYYNQALTASAATATALESLATSSGGGGAMPANTATAGRMAHYILDIPNYANATNKKSYSGSCINPNGTLTGTLSHALFGGSWDAAAAITRITLICGAGNFAIGSRLTVYAKGA